MVELLGRGFAWLDIELMIASQNPTFIGIEKRTGLKVGCLEGIAYREAD